MRAGRPPGRALAFLLPAMAACLLMAGPARADEVRMANGDVLSGRVVKVEGGTLTFETGYSAPVKIDVSKIASIRTDGEVEVHLEGGEVLRGRLVTEDGGVLVEPSAERGAASIQWGRVKAINPPSKWSGSVTVGGNLQSGNTDRLGASLAAEAVRKAERDRFSMRFIYNYAEEDDEITERNAFGALKYDYFFTRKVYGLLSLEMLSDEFRDISLRTAVGPGVGYQVWDDAVRSLGLEVGVTYFNEDRETGEDDRWLTGRLAAILRWKVFGFVVFSDYLTIYPSLEDTGEYQLRNEAGLSTSLGASWALRLANVLEHDSQPVPGIKKTDLSWILGLQYSF